MPQSYFERTQNGAYDDIVAMFRNESEALVNLDFNEGYTGETVPWNDKPLNFTTRFIRSDTDRTELVANIFGEVRGAEHGTSISCFGLRYKDGEKIKDSVASSIKDEIVIGLPTNATDELARLYENQIIALNQILFGELPDIDTRGVHKKSWFRNNPDSNKDNIVITMPAKYKVVQHSDNHRMVKKRPHGEMDDDQVKVASGALYDPALLPDYDAAICQFQHAKLVQQELYNIHGELVAPWITADTLQKGVVVAIEARLFVYHFTENNPTSKYQVQSRSIRALIDSPEPKVATIQTTPKRQPPLEAPSPSKLFLKLAKNAEGATRAKQSGSGRRHKKA